MANKRPRRAGRRSRLPPSFGVSAHAQLLSAPALTLIAASSVREVETLPLLQTTRPPRLSSTSVGGLWLFAETPCPGHSVLLRLTSCYFIHARYELPLLRFPCRRAICALARRAQLSVRTATYHVHTTAVSSTIWDQAKRTPDSERLRSTRRTSCPSPPGVRLPNMRTRCCVF